MSAALQSLGNDRDAHVVEDICGYITATPPRSFFLFAGAGSGKTRTLVEVLRRVTGVVKHEAGGRHAERLRSRGQSVRVITYTKNATAVVNGRLGENYLTAVSTIHSFCWELIKDFHDDIRDALLARNAKKLAAAKAYAMGKVKGESEKDREKYAEIEAEAEEIRKTDAFIYHPDRDTYGQGALSHGEVLEVTAWLIRERPTLQRILEDRHPLILIDESQDTMKGVLDALFELSRSRPGQITLGLLGDHRQRIYPDGHDDLPSHVPEDWARPALRMNHRSQQRIVELINKIWDADIEGRTQPKTGVPQHSRTEKNGGTVRIFVGDTKTDTAEKIRKETDCALAMAAETGSSAWQHDVRGYKTLALEHKLAAKRGNFFEAYNAMDLLDKDAAMPKSNGERTGPSIVRPLLGPILELAQCRHPDGSLNEFASTDVLRRHGALAELPQASAERQAALDNIYAAVLKFADVISKPEATVREVLAPVLEGRLFEADFRLVQAYGDSSPPPPEPKARGKEAKEDRRKRGWHALFSTSWRQIARYRAYLDGQAELATHQVVKGSEFKHVMVVMDDEDAGGTLISYDKLFGAEELSSTDRENVDGGKETTIDRTLRLLYVTCSRAEESLALVLWAKNPNAAIDAIKRSEWFAADEVIALK
ncbi:RecBCD enzyme subunit RecB [Paraburkholderia ultramafica]|uniref:DNA 3'-5' helicase II n=1 Tax=Paraburkholderia ultramafica TaxID=1544867 RepID=A0A6S7BKW9_9BURK|nr:UvrD-helicase domain-containing protein [Paraburkholderia ultramafica]CAB3802503.1 RecBCD enzyme subunit RecB [Paraburkholderia ultramafica]